MAEKPWDGRFAEKTDKSVEAFTASIAYDRRLYPYDIDGSIAHCRMLASGRRHHRRRGRRPGGRAGHYQTGVGSGRVQSSTTAWKTSTCTSRPACCRMVGKVAQKLHTARSRNDQVALDVRMYLRDETRRTIDLLQRCGRCWWIWPTGTRMWSCPVTPISSGPSRCFLPTT